MSEAATGLLIILVVLGGLAMALGNALLSPSANPGAYMPGPELNRAWPD